MTLSEATRRVLGAAVEPEFGSEAFVARFARQGELATELQAADPLLRPVTSMIIAGDRQSADRADEWVRSGADAAEVSAFVGSYARLDFLVRWRDVGRVDEGWLLDELPGLWSGSDPDDSDPRFLRLWYAARRRNRGLYVRDGRALPRGPGLTLFRGQDAGAIVGCSWTLDPKVARRFADGAATRQADRGGVVLRCDGFPRRAALAYLTGRGEQEVIVDPRDLERVLEGGA